MASVTPKKKSGRIVSYKFKTCVGRDGQGKQIFRCTTWIPPEGMNTFKANRAAEKAALEWEDAARAEYEQEQTTVTAGTNYNLPPEQRHDDFNWFISDVWLPLHVRSGSMKPTSIAFYEHMTKIITGYFKGAVLQEIGPLDIQKYLVYLRTEYRTKLGQLLSPKSIRHQYSTLNLIFGYAEKQEMIVKNPMNKVDAPKKVKKPVKALTSEQAVLFFQVLKSCPLDLQCMLQLLITTGIRRGECMGLQWQDIDEQAYTIHIVRNVSYTSQSGVVVNTPKTINSIRSIPITPGTLNLLLKLKHEVQKNHPRANLDTAYLFPKGEAIFTPHDPNAITRKVKQFMKNNGLPILSPHCLRRTCATLLLTHGADIKSVQDILGHVDASTTLNYYVKSDISQMKAATNRLANAFNI